MLSQGSTSCNSTDTEGDFSNGVQVACSGKTRTFTALMAFGNVRSTAGLSLSALGGVDSYQAQDFPGVRPSSRRLVLPEHFHFALERQRGVLRSLPAQFLLWDFMSPNERAQ